ncbi:MAG: alpha-mannosidase [Promethearchaeota archaeon]
MVRAKIGRISGNERIDTSDLQEPDADTEFTRNLWLKEIKEDPDFREEIAKRVEGWKNAISITTDPSKIDIHLVGESHIDVAWLWRYEQTRKKAIVTFRKAVMHARMFPGKYCFALSEPILLEWVKEDDPDLFKDIQETVKEGGIELVGGSFVEPDCMMPSGEAFVRQRLYGQRFFRDNFNYLPEVEWFLDSFGYNWGLPQILAKSGAKYFWTSKITWNMQTTFPFVNFWWEGPDGTRILTANFQMGPGPVNSWVMYEIGRHLLKPSGRKVWNYNFDYEEIDEHVEEDAICPVVGNFSGKGDGGHGPTHQEVAEFNEYDRLGFMHWSRVKNFFTELEKWSDRFPIWKDELYLENHRGTFSVHAEVKRHNRFFENSLTSVEGLATCTTFLIDKYKYPRKRIENVWKMTLKNQFHDVLPGSSVPEVYDDSVDDWDYGKEVLSSILKDISGAFGKGGKTMNLLFFNPVSWNRKSPVFIPLSAVEPVPPLDSSGKPPYANIAIEIEGPGKSETIFPCQPIAGDDPGSIDPKPAGWWVVLELKPMSITRGKLVLDKKQPSPSTNVASNNILDNGLCSIRLDPITGGLTELVVPSLNGGKNLLKGKSSNLSSCYKDQSKSWPAWNLEPQYWKHPVDIANDKNVTLELIDNGPVFSTIEIRRDLGESPVIQRVTLFDNCTDVYLEWSADWKRKNVMIKVGFETTTNATTVIADISYAAIERSTRPDVPCDKARYEKICHKYFDLSTPDKRWGLAVVNEGKYAFDAAEDTMRITMLRSPEYPGPAGEAFINKERILRKEKYGTTVPSHSGMGPFKCRYALVPHAGGALRDASGNANTIVKQRAEEFNQPVLVIPSTTELIINAECFHGVPFVSISPTNVQVTAVKMDEWKNDGHVILRIVEVCGVGTTAEINLAPFLNNKTKEVQPTDLLERDITANTTWDKKTGKISFKIKPFEIFTLKLVIANDI